MAWWSHFFERRTQSWPLSGLHTWADMGIGDGPTDAGVTVTAETAMRVPAVFSCVSVLSQDVARTPIKLRRKVAADSYVDATEHDLFEILGSLANPETTAYAFKLQMMLDLLQHEHAFAQIVRTPDGRVQALWRLDPTLMRVDRDASRRKRWTYGSTVWHFDPSMPPIFELAHPSPIRRCRDVIGSTAALQSYVAKFFANDARPGGVLQAAGAISDDAATRLSTHWRMLFGSGGANRRGVAVLDNGLEFKPIAMDNDAAQLNETLRSLNTQIAGIFRVPLWKIGDTTNANYSNMEASELSYTTSTLDPYFECWESALKRDVLSTRQYGQFTISFDRSALVRNDVKSLHDSLARGIQSGIYSQNDARKLLGLNPIPDGDRYLVNSALQPVGANSDPTIA